MSKASFSTAALPPIVRASLRQLGENLSIARLRRRESRRVWAERLGVSIPTLIRLEKGAPGVGIGIVATAVWLMGRIQAFSDLADPGSDRGALELDLRKIRKKHAKPALSLVPQKS